MQKKYIVCFVGVLIIFSNCSNLFSAPIDRIDSISNLQKIDLKEKKDLLEAEALAIKNISSERDRINANITLGDAFKKLGVLDRALEITSEAISEAKRIKAQDLLALSYLTMGEVYRAAKGRDLALDNLAKSLDLLKKMNNAREISKVYGRYAAVYYENFLSSSDANDDKRNAFCDSVKYYVALANSIAEPNCDTAGIISNYNILGALYSVNNNIDSADYFFKKALALTTSIKYENESPIILWNISALYLKKKDYQNTISFGIRGYNLAVKYDYRLVIKLIAEVLNTAYKEIGDYKNALFYLEIAYNYSNSIYSSQIATTTLKLQTEFVKEKEEAKIQANKKYWIVVSTSIAVSAILIIFVIFFYYRRVKRANEKLHAMNEINETQNKKLHELNQTKDKFFSIIAHDLRNPLSAIVQSAEILDKMFDDFSPEESKEFISLQFQSAKKLNDLLDNLLTWARSQRGSIEFQPQEIKAKELLQATQYLLKNQAENKNIALDINLENSAMVFADQNMILTVLRNLCSNAIKFTPENGKVKINFDQNERESIFSVADNGQGISQEDIGKLFKLDVSHTTIGSSGEKGTGLGLILCQEFVIKHGGHIWVESELGKGSTFYFSLQNAHKEI